MNAIIERVNKLNESLMAYERAYADKKIDGASFPMTLGECFDEYQLLFAEGAINLRTYKDFEECIHRIMDMHFAW